MAKKRVNLPEVFTLGHSGDADIANVLPAGVDAWYSVIAGTLPQLALSLWNSRAEPDTLGALHSECAPLWACFNLLGSIRVVPDISRTIGLGAYDLPLPLQPLEPDAVAQIEKALEQLSASNKLLVWGKAHEGDIIL